MINRFTLVLKGHIALAMAHFPEGTTGAQIDTLARRPLWNEELDYAHGTGHGVGCYLAVHEEAASISPRGKEAFKPGMLISNEPGYYKEGEYGIRIENLVFVKTAGRCADTGAQMLQFETISYAPIDRALIDMKLLNAEEKAWLNAYHKQVYTLISPGLNADERAWLKSETAPL
jgi:Xaa-Pro aminopeptidase